MRYEFIRSTLTSAFAAVIIKPEPAPLPNPTQQYLGMLGSAAGLWHFGLAPPWERAFTKSSAQSAENAQKRFMAQRLPRDRNGVAQNSSLSTAGCVDFQEWYNPLNRLPPIGTHGAQGGALHADTAGVGANMQVQALSALGLQPKPGAKRPREAGASVPAQPSPPKAVRFL